MSEYNSMVKISEQKNIYGILLWTNNNKSNFLCSLKCKLYNVCNFEKNLELELIEI